MCLPVTLLKFYVFFAGVVNILIGIGSLVISGLVNGYSDKLFPGGTDDYK